MSISFLTSEDGAVTVDYVVLTAGVTGMGLAMIQVLTPALGTMAGRISTALETTVSGAPVFGTYLVGNDFASGADGWTGATATTVDGFGKVLGPIAGSQGLESVSTTIDIPEGSQSAIVTFDLLAFDSLEDEDAVLYVDGVEVGRMTSLHGALTWTPGSVEGITLNASLVADSQPLGGMQSGPEEWWNDGIGAVTIVVDNPSDTLSFGLGSTADSAISDESWGIDNFVVSVQ